MIVHLIEARRNEISIATASVRSQIVGSPALAALELVA